MGSSTETGSIGAVWITAASVWGFIAAMVTAYYLWAMSFDERAKAGESEEAVGAKKVRIVRRQMALYAASSAWIMFFVTLMCEFEIGTLTRSGDVVTINWTYFSLSAAAWAVAAWLHAIYFRFTHAGQNAVLSAMWAVAMVVLGVAPLTTGNTKRDLLYGISVALQGVSVLFIFWFQGRKGPLFRWRGWSTLVWVIVAFVIIDVFWYIGYENAQRKATQLDARWKSQLPFFLGNLCGLVVAASMAAWTYKAKSGDVKAMMREAAEREQEQKLLEQEEGEPAMYSAGY